MRKKLLSFVLCLVLSVGAVPGSAFAEAIETETETLLETEPAAERGTEFEEESETEGETELKTDVEEESVLESEDLAEEAGTGGSAVHEITGFAEFDIVEHSLNYAPDQKPSLKQLLKKMPKTLGVCLDESMIPMDIPVSWVCIDQDYENSDSSFYQFVPIWDTSFVLAEYIDLQKDAPYIGVFFYGEDDDPYKLDASCLSGTKSIYITRLDKNSFVFNGKSYTAKKSAMLIIAERLLEAGFEPAFIAGVLANVACEGSFGKFENITGYTVERLLQVYPNLGTKENYIAHMKGFTDYDSCGHDHSEYTAYYKKSIYDGCSLETLSEILARYANEGWKAKFGLGSIQWTGRRTATLVNDFYRNIAESSDTITLAQCSEAEMQMIVYELKGSYNSVYVNWKKANDTLDSESAAENAGYRICYYYEIPASRESSSQARGVLAKSIYSAMTTGTEDEVPAITAATVNGKSIILTYTRPLDADQVKIELLNSDAEIVGQAKTESGTWEFAELDPGTYTVLLCSVWKDGTASKKISKVLTVPYYSLVTKQTILDGQYSIHTKADIHRSLYTEDSGTASGVNAAVYDYDKMNSDCLWTITYQKEGYYKIVNNGSGKELRAENTTSGKLWQIIPTDEGCYLVPQCAATSCLEVAENIAEDENGQVVQIQRSDASLEQKWIVTEEKTVDERLVVRARYSGKCYEVYDYSVSWEQARSICAQKGGHLVTIEDADENAFVLTQIEKGSKNYYYLGACKEETEGVWKWVTGEAFLYDNWSLQESAPNGGDTENRAAIIAKTSMTETAAGEWIIHTGNDKSNSFYDDCNSGFICEYEPCDVHSFGAYLIVAPATCTEAGTRTAECSRCGAVKTEPIEMLPHTVVKDSAVKATCTTAGKTEGSHCSVCGIVIKAQMPMDAKGHTIVDDPAVPATCIAAGKTAGSHCSVCGMVFEAQTLIPMVTHISDEGEKIGAVTTYRCSYCQTVLRTESDYKLKQIKNVSGGVKLTWDKYGDEYQYAVYYKAGETGSWKKATTTRSGYYTKKSLRSGTTYYFKIKCLDRKGKAIPGYISDTMSIRYLAVPTLKKVSVVPGGIAVSWKPVTGAAGYCVYQKTAGEAYQRVAETTGTTALLVNLTTGSGYSFTVACMDDEGNKVSAYTAKGLSATYVSPGKLTGVSNEKTLSMRVTWDKNEDAAGYDIQYSTYKDFRKGNKTVTISGGGQLSTKVKNLRKGTTYYVRIRSWIKNGKKKYYSAWTMVEDNYARIVK